MSAEQVFFYAVSALCVALILVLPVLIWRGRHTVRLNDRVVANQTVSVANDTRRVAALEQIAASLARIEAHLGTTPRG
jgi:hypothetical protein